MAEPENPTCGKETSPPSKQISPLTEPNERAPGELPSITPREEIGKHLLPLLELHRRPYRPGVLSLFCEALADLTPREVDLGFRECAKRLKFFPTPADVREALNVALERMPQQTRRLADENCARCNGTGWEIVERGGRRMAILCSCTKQSAA